MSLTRRELLNLSKLVRRRERTRQGRVLIEGVRSVEAAIDGGASIETVLVAEPAMADSRVRALVEKGKIPLETLSPRELAKIADTETTQGVIAIAGRFVFDSIGEASGMSRILVLSGVQDPGNVGTLIRTAAWFGIEGVLADERTADFESPKVIRSSMGGAWDLSLSRVKELDEELGRLCSAGFDLVGGDVTGEPVESWRPKPPTALILGSEAHGFSKAIARHVDKRVSIQRNASSRAVESLNVAIAGGILMAHWSGKIDHGRG